MDSLTHLALGAAIGMATLGRRTALWKAALWGCVANTLPDLDVFINHGDAISNVTLHRGHSHSLFWLTLLAPALAWGVARLHGEAALWRRWWLALWLSLVSHPLLDTLTVYGTQLLQPFSDHPYGVGSLFIIDPAYTVPLLVGVGVALARRDTVGLRWARGALALSTLYLGWSLVAQWQVQRVVGAQLAAAGVAPERVLVTPAPFNTLLWRIVVMRDGAYDEGFYSLLDSDRPIRFDAFTGDAALAQQAKPLPGVQQIASFSHGFYKLQERAGVVHVTDLRMGQEPAYAFSFRVGQRAAGGALSAVAPVNEGLRGDVRAALAWLGPRMLGSDIPPPR
ncbi:MAG TPA: metal-dependent hydrolase [Ramlibacter sp.]|nr:metal-dependent hydrolase [Ramlibacter sp.]